MLPLLLVDFPEFSEVCCVDAGTVPLLATQCTVESCVSDPSSPLEVEGCGGAGDCVDPPDSEILLSVSEACLEANSFYR